MCLRQVRIRLIAIAGMLFLTSWVNCVSATTLAHLYTFEQSDLADSAGTITGTFVGRPEFVPGRVDQKAVFLDGDDDEIRLPDVDLGNQYSLACWIKPAYDGGYTIQPIIATDSDAKDPSRFYIHFNDFRTINGKIQLMTRESGGPRIPATGEGAIHAGVWTSVVVTVDMTSPPAGANQRDAAKLGTVHIYVNGQDVSTQTAVLNDLTTKASLVLGRIPTTGFKYRGAIDDFRIYDGVLSAEEVQTLGQIPPGGDKTGTSPVLNVPPADQILSTLKAGHPRVILTQERLATMRSYLSTDETFKDWFASLKAYADAMAAVPVAQYPGKNTHLLEISRQSLDRVTTLGLVYQLTNDRKYADRAWKELEALAAFPDWDPDHWLDTAEMSAAFALGYDWLYDAWTPDQRTAINKALIDKGLSVGLDTYEERKKYGWYRVTFNWNQVCNGGMVLGALAIADEEPALASKLVRYAALSLPRAMVQFAPDGACPEAPNYWNYATMYTVMTLSALHSALDTDFGLSKIESFDKVANFPLYVSGPFGNCFNYGDAPPDTTVSPEMFWLASFFRQPAWAHYQRQAIEAEENRHARLPFDMVWYDPAVIAQPSEVAPLDKYFRGTELVTLRGTWNDINTSFLGVRAGDNAANHAHLSAGSFVFDALGYRWAWQQGADSYGRAGYFDFSENGARWTYYRTRAEGHNTLVINPGRDPDQLTQAKNKIVRFEGNVSSPFTIMDLTPAYANHASNVTRGFKLIDRKQALIQDEVRSDNHIDLWWFMHTLKTVSISSDGRIATLSKLGKSVEVRLLSPADAKFAVMAAVPLPSSPKPVQAPPDQLKKLVIHLSGVRDARIVVLLVPISTDADKTFVSPAVVPLAGW